MEPIQKILVPVDFSAPSRAALEYAGFVAERLGASLDVLHVWETPRYVTPEAPLGVPDGRPQTLEEFARESAGRDIDELIGLLEGRTLPRIGRRIETGVARDAILEAARDGGYHMVIMGTHGRRGLSHLLMGSVAEEVVRRAPCPVLTVGVP